MTSVLTGTKILDFSTMLPGPLATLILAEAGAEVIKVEPVGGEAGRADAAIFGALNRGKRSIAIDLKTDLQRLLPLIAEVDVLIEQFRPGVMDRLGLGETAVRALNPAIIYVSINGYGSAGPDAMRPGHDLTYSAESGLLSLNADREGSPIVPAALAADIGTSHRAVVNILLALLRRDRAGLGCRVEIDMMASTLPFLNEAIAHAGVGIAPAPCYSPATGSSPRYNIYRTRDARDLAVACAEDKFWLNFCDLTGLGVDADRNQVAACIAARDADVWTGIFAGQDVCVSLILTVVEAMESDRLRRLLAPADGGFPAGVVDVLKGSPLVAAPALGEGNSLLR